jgi:NTP pyrophosphatase (non-canonical NTP hydrolase)
MRMTQQLQKRTFRSLQKANEARNAEWDPDGKLDLSFAGIEHAGEVGEAMEVLAAQIEKALTALDHVAAAGKVSNVVKKRVREDRGIRGSRATLEDLALELADDVITAYLVARRYNINLDVAIERKFNATSEKQGLHVFLDLTTSHDMTK